MCQRPVKKEPLGGSFGVPRALLRGDGHVLVYVGLATFGAAPLTSQLLMLFSLGVQERAERRLDECA